MSQKRNPNYSDINIHAFDINPRSNPEAVSRAVSDALTLGIGALSIAGLSHDLSDEYGRSFPKKMGAKRYVNQPAQLIDAVDAIRELTVHQSNIMTTKSALIATGSRENWHIDSDNETNDPGVRLITQLSGPESGIMIIDRNTNMETTDPESPKPKENSGLLVARLALDTVLILPESNIFPTVTFISDEAHEIEHPYHTRFMLDSSEAERQVQRNLMITDLVFMNKNGFDGDRLGLEPSDLRLK